MIITKGALQNVLDICSLVEIGNGKVEYISKYYQKIRETFKDLGNQGFQSLGYCLQNNK
jgi:Mg2+-importing ATPase